MKKRLECVIRGRVQLVMFRDFTKRNADQVGVFGTVQNEEDGSVRVVAEGEEEALATFVKALRGGPLFSRVDNVEERWTKPTGEFSSFTILYY